MRRPEINLSNLNNDLTNLSDLSNLRILSNLSDLMVFIGVQQRCARVKW